MNIKAKPHSNAHLNPSRQQGSALLTALIFAVLIGIASVSYLKLASSEYRASVRSSLYASSLNLAETGVEMAVESLNGGDVDTSTWKKTHASYLQDGGMQGDVAVVVFDATSLQPTVFAEGVVKGHPAGDVVKQVRVELKNGIIPFEKGFSARDGITFSGNNVLLDSWNSLYGPYGGLLPLTYVDLEGNVQEVPSDFGVDDLNKNDDIFVASDRIETTNGATAVDAGNAEVYGYVTVSPDSTVDIGPQGKVTTYDDGTHDESRVLSDFYADFPPISYEVDSSVTVQDGGSITSAGSLGAVGTSATYTVDEISLGGNSSSMLNINGDVTIIMNGDISISGQASLNITSGSSLTIYTSHDVAIAGNGVANDNYNPSSFSLFGTAPENVSSDGEVSAAQSISITGNGELQSVVYAPTADVSLTGGGNSGQVFGGVVGLTANITGNSSFHFDEALRDLVINKGVYSIYSWLEMTGSTAANTPIDLSEY